MELIDKNWMRIRIAAGILGVNLFFLTVGLFFAAVWVHGDVSSRYGGSGVITFILTVIAIAISATEDN